MNTSVVCITTIYQRGRERVVTCATMTLNLSQFEMVGGFAAHNNFSMAAPVVCKAVNCSRKSRSSSFFFARSDLSCRASSSVDKIKGDLEMEQGGEEQDYKGTPYVPVYVMLPHGIIHWNFGLRYYGGDLYDLKSMNVDGVKVECWWGIVERLVPQQYDWSQYKSLFEIVKKCNLKLQVVFCFHAYVGDGMSIPLPRWVMEVGKKNPNIFFTDRDGRRNYECLTWGIDRETVLMNRTPSQVYYDFMNHFHQEFEEFFVDGSICGIEIGLGPCGELRFPFQTRGCSWEYPAIEEFPCYDEYMIKSLKKAWKERGESLCGVRTPTKGSHDRSSTWRAKYLCERSREYVSFYGRFFLSWYSKVLVDHADMLLFAAKTTLSHNCNIAAKIPGISHLWYEMDIPKCDAPIITTLKNYKTRISSKCGELRAICHGEDFPELVAEEMGMGWQVLCAAWAAGIPVAGENDFPCYDRRGYQEILEVAKPTNDPTGRHLSSFTYLSLSPQLMEKRNLNEFGRFIQRMHGRSTT